MPFAWRFLLLICSLSLLSGCNLVVSEKPWFSEKDAVGVPPLRDGLWASFGAGSCEFDSSRPVADWPQCAQPLLVRSGQYLYAQETQEDAAATSPGPVQWQPIGHLLVAGDPLIDQFDNPVPQSSRDDRQFGHFYRGVRIAKTGDDGRIIEFVGWPVVCGPLRSGESKKHSKARAEASVSDNVTDKPFPGLTVNLNNCLAADQAVLRKAAVLSESVSRANGTALTVSRWVRDSAP
jgi:hypothetical protein